MRSDRGDGAKKREQKKKGRRTPLSERLEQASKK